MYLHQKMCQRLTAHTKTVAAIFKNFLGSSENDTEDVLSHYNKNLRDRVLKLICFKHNYSTNYT